jgi:hypothetical protein
MGLKQSPAFLVYPYKNGASSSFNSTSACSSSSSIPCYPIAPTPFSSSIKFRTFPPFSLVYSHKSGEAILFLPDLPLTDSDVSNNIPVILPKSLDGSSGSTLAGF